MISKLICIITINLYIQLQAIKAGEVVSNFQGVGLGDSWISPIDSVNTWGPFLYSMVRLIKIQSTHGGLTLRTAW